MPWEKGKQAHNFIDLVGQVFGRWTVIERAENGKKGEVRWLCECDCDNKTRRVVSRGNLRSGESTNCGCVRLEGLYNYNPTKKEFGASTKNAVYKIYEISARKRNLDFDLDKDFFYILLQANCFYCGCEPKQIKKSRNNNGDFIYNGIDRIDNTKGYIKDNVVSCCGKCNMMKLNMTQEEFFNRIKLIYEKHNLGGVK